MRVTCYLRGFRGDTSLRQFADTAGVSRGTISQIENGRRFPSDKERPLLVAAYGQPVENWYPPHVVVELSDDQGEPVAEAVT